MVKITDCKAFQNIYESALLLLIRTTARIFYDIKVYNIERIPKRKVIIVANHTSFGDPIFILAGVKEKAYFLVKHYLQPTKKFKDSFFGKFLTLARQIILENGKADKESYRKALDVLDRGDILGIFPEGTRSPNGELQTLEEGVARISYKAHVPILPLYIKGAHECWPRHQKFPRLFKRIELYVEEPIYIDYSKPKKDEIKRIMSDLERRLSGINS